MMGLLRMYIRQHQLLPDWTPQPRKVVDRAPRDVLHHSRHWYHILTEHRICCPRCGRLPIECVCPDLAALQREFLSAYRKFRRAWRETGGTLEMQLQIRDGAAEERFQRRLLARAKKGAVRRRRSRGE